MKKTIKTLFTLFIMAASGFFLNAQAQSTIVNYDFNSGASYAALTPTLSIGVTATASSTEAFTTFGGIATDASAFTTNATAGNAVAMANSSGTNTRYFQFDLGGANLPSYKSYKLYFQAQRSGTGAQVVTVAYSSTGCAGAFTNFGTTMSVATTFATSTPEVFDLSGITALDNQANVCFRLLASGASGTGTLRIDNFQVQAVLPPLAAEGVISGRVTDVNGNGLAKVRLTLSGGELSQPIVVRTNAFGYYTLPEVEVGATYTLTASDKRYTFANPSRVINLQENISDADFVSEN